jgi:hypothetical protein
MEGETAQMANDFERVKILLKDAVRETLDTLRSEHSEEHFYAFALYDADGDCVCPSANSVERYQAIIRKKRLEDSDKRFMYRWGTAEWAYEGVEYGPFEQAREILRAAPRENWFEFQAQSFGASILALKELSDEGFFGAGNSRITAFFSLSDDNNAPWLERESARRINPPSVFAAFEAEWRLASATTWGDVDIDGGELAEAFIRFHGPG